MSCTIYILTSRFRPKMKLKSSFVSFLKCALVEIKIKGQIEKLYLNTKLRKNFPHKLRFFLVALFVNMM